MQHLLFRLYGPMAAWGEVAVGETRPTATRPSKSAVIGLLAAALGVDRDDDKRHRQLDRSLGYAAQVQSVGKLLRDFHTIQVPPARRGAAYESRRAELRAARLETLLSTRDYRCDAASVVCVWLKEYDGPTRLPDLQRALRRPGFTLYLGRKSCPLALPLQPQIVESTTLADAFEKAEFEALEGVEVAERFDFFWEEHPRAGLTTLSSGPRRDGLVSRRRWQFYERIEHRGIYAQPKEDDGE